MNSSVSLRSTFTWSMILVALLSILMVGSFWVIQEYIRFSDELVNQKNDYVATKKSEIKVEVDHVIDFIEYKRSSTEQQLKESIQTRVYEAITMADGIYNTYHGQKSEIEIQDMIKEALRPIVFNNGRGYFYIYDLQGNNILLPFSPQMEGTNLWNFQDSKGTYAIQNTAKMIEEKGEGFQRWYWYKPGIDDQMFEKIGFNKKFEPYDWWIGTGEYIDDFQRDVQRETLEWINTIHYGQEGYIFTYNYDGTILAHFLKETIGDNVLLDTSDPYGIQIVGDLIRISQQEGGGFLEYKGKIRPSTGLGAEKIGYSRSVDDWQWTVGTGVYVDYINEVIEAERKALIKLTIKNILFSLTIFVLSLFIIWFLLKYISQKTTDHIAIFTRFFKQSSTELLEINHDEVRFSEFKSLADSANQMVRDRKSAEDEIRHLRNYLSNIINSMPSVLIGVDGEGRVAQWNRQAELVTGLSFEKAFDQPLATVFPQLSDKTELISSAIKNREVLKELKVPHEINDEIRYENVIIYPLITNGVEGAVIRVDDVTDQVKIEEMMVQSEKMMSVGGLAAGMAHEINNPLAGMIQTANVLKSRLFDLEMSANIRAAEEIGISLKDIGGYMEKRSIMRMVVAINESGQRVAEIVNNMLSFARKSDAIVSSHTMDKLMDQTLELAAADYDLKKQYDFKTIKIIKEYEEFLPMLPCEGAKIQQVLLNILRNGAQAMQSEEINQEREPCFIIRMQVEKKYGMLRIEIEDNGPGMDKATQARVFEPFFTTKPAGVGTGLGLSVSYFIISENHRGTMHVDSSRGKGTTFIIRLPLEPWGEKDET